MRLKDILPIQLLLALAILLAFRGLRQWARPARLLWASAIVILLALQIAFRQFYWQLLPADLAGLLLAIAWLRLGRLGTLSSRLFSLASLLLLGTSFACLFLLPLFRLPAPTGPYPVGTRILCLTDASRADATFPGGHRELMVQVWYPAAGRDQPLASYRRWKETTMLSSYDAFLKTHSHLNAAISRRGSPFPVLLFNPAWGGERTQNTYETEDLASHGYIVIAIDHTHNSSLVAFPDGQVVRAASVQPIDDFINSTFEKQMSIADRELDTQAKDDIFVLNAFAAKNANPGSPWFHTLDMQRIGAFGHSFGGATSVEACFRDPRIRAALNMDGWMYGEIAQKSLDKPLFVMYEEGWPPDATQRAREMHSSQPGDRTDIWDLRNLNRTLTQHGGYLLTIHNTRHMNFSDRSLYSPIRRLTDSGSIDPVLAHRIINQYTLAFFDHVLKGWPEPLLNPSHQPWAPASFSKWPRAQTASIH